MNQHRLSAHALSVAYGDRTVLGPVDLSLPPGEVTCIVGANASGKSTLLRSLARLLKPSGGQVLLDGADIAFLHLILDIPADEVRMGMRVKAVWKPEDEWGTTIENISHFSPTGDPDADYETYKNHL